MRSAVLVAALAQAARAQIIWRDALTLTLGGRAFTDTSPAPYARLPAAAQADVSPAEWAYSRDSAGTWVGFATDATAIHLNFTLVNNVNPPWPNFSPIGYSGCDLDRFDEASGVFRWVASTFVGLEAALGKNASVVVESPFFADGGGWPAATPPSNPTENTTYRYRLRLPSYNGVSSVQIGVPQAATLTPDTAWKPATAKPITYLGTSITQGGLTARPGETYVSRISVALGTEVLNQGYCGSCELEAGLAKWTSAIDASLLVIDCGWNANAATLHDRLLPFVSTFRASYPAIPVVLVEPSDYRPAWILGDVNNVTGRRAEIRAAFTTLVAGGDAHVYLVDGASLFAGEDEDPTFEGVHPLGRGHQRIATVMANVIGGLLRLPTLPTDDDADVSSIVAGTWPVPAAPPAGSAVYTAAGAWVSAAVAATLPTPTPLPAPVHRATAGGPLTWTDATPFIVGRAFNDTPSPWNRLPKAAQADVRPAVWSLSIDSAGIMVSFTTDSPSLALSYTTRANFDPMVHFPATGVSGADLFAYDDSVTPSVLRFVAAANLPLKTNNYTATIAANFTTTGPVRFVLYLATYNEVTGLLLGTEAGSTLTPSSPFATPRQPIVWYGTSILQGGVSTKPSRMLTARVSRSLDVEVYNFGFSGNCLMELSVAKYLTTIQSPSVIVIDCVKNMNGPEIANNTVPLVQFFRANGHPTTPIVLVEGIVFGRAWAAKDAENDDLQDNAALQGAYETLVAGGDKNLYYVTSESQFSAAGLLDTPTGNALHPSDRGFADMTDLFVGMLRPLVGA